MHSVAGGDGAHRVHLPHRILDRPGLELRRVRLSVAGGQDAGAVQLRLPAESVKREQTENLHKLGFWADGRSCPAWAAGVGKAHLAIRLAMAATQTGQRQGEGAL